MALVAREVTFVSMRRQTNDLELVRRLTKAEPGVIVRGFSGAPDHHPYGRSSAILRFRATAPDHHDRIRVGACGLGRMHIDERHCPKLGHHN